MRTRGAKNKLDVAAISGRRKGEQRSQPQKARKNVQKDSLGKGVGQPV